MSWLSLKNSIFLYLRLAAPCLALVLCTPVRLQAAFGVTSSGGNYIVDTGAGLVFKVSQTSGDINSIVFNSVEYQATDKNSHIASGLGTATVTATTYGANYIKIAIATDAANGVVTSLTHYLMVKNGVNTIYMATYATAEPAVGELRWITRLQTTKLFNGPVPSDNRGTTNAIESTDIFGKADGTTRSKYYGDNATHGKDRAMDLSYCGVKGASVGVWMVYDNPRESASSGPFFRDIQHQCGTADQEVYNYMNSGHNNTEAWRVGGVLHGPYALVFTTGATPILPVDYSWIETGGLNLIGWVASTNRGAVKGAAYGIPAGFQGVVGFANTNAQYWATVSSNGTYLTPLMKPGDYTVKLYKGELEVLTNSVTVTAGQTNTLDLASVGTAPTCIFRVGEWDGSPAGFLNASNIIVMHPQDVRNANWAPGTFTVGVNSNANFPAVQFRLTNSPLNIVFNMDAGQIATMTLRIGITCAYHNGRPKPTIGSWVPSNPAQSSQPDSRSFTLGTYRGNNAVWTWSVPSSAFVAGANTLSFSPISGTGDLSTWLSAGYGIDAVELSIPGTSPALPDAPSDLAAAALNGSQINLTWTDNATNEINTLIERSTDGVNFELVGAVTANVMTYTDNGLAPGTTNYYRLRTFNAGGYSSYTATASAVTTLPLFTSVQLSNGNLVLGGNGGPASGSYQLLTSSNLTLPLDLWSGTTNKFDGSGAFSVTNPANSPDVLFFRIKIP